ncbi:MAG: GH19, partial [uncultured Rubrobacteraceae bacterium]
RRGYFDVHDRARPFDLQEAKRRPWTLIGRKFRDAYDQGHAAIVLPGGKVLQSYPAARVNDEVTLERSHAGGYYEVMVFPKDWSLPLDHEESEDKGSVETRNGDRPKRQPDRGKPVPEKPEREEEEQEVPLFTARQLSEMSGNQDLDVLEKYRQALVPAMRKAGITTPLRMAAFFGNVMVETAALKTLEEYGNEAYFRYGPQGGDGLYLGNEWRYHGRGFLMNTWKAAYANLSKVLDADLVANPDLLERSDYAARAATWFWDRHDLNSYADKGNFRAVAAIINTGRADGTPNHWTERLQFYDRAKRVLSNGSGGRPDGERPDPEKLDRDGFNRDGLPYINLVAVGEADETAAFVLAAEIRKAGVGVTVTNGADNVYALAKKVRPECLGNRQVWIMGRPALEACGEYGDLANWPVSPKTDYYDLSGKSLTGTCGRAAELADERAKRGVGQRFLEVMGMAEPGPARSRLPAPKTPQDESEEPEPDGNGDGNGGLGRREGRSEGGRSNPRSEARRDLDERRGDGGYEEPAGTLEKLTDEDLEEIGRRVLQLVSGVRGHNGRGKTARTGSPAHEEGD